MIPKFYSSPDGFFVGEMYVIPDVGGPVINEELYVHFDRDIYRHTSATPVATIGYDTYFDLEADANVPIDTMGIPDDWFDTFGLQFPPCLAEVAIAAPEVAHEIDNGKKISVAE